MLSLLTDSGAMSPIRYVAAVVLVFLLHLMSFLESSWLIAFDLFCYGLGDAGESGRLLENIKSLSPYLPFINISN